MAKERLLNGRPQQLDVEQREGTILGAVSTFTGAPQRVRLRARGTVWACIFNEAELEQLVTCNSSVAVRMIRTLATRIAEGPPRVEPTVVPLRRA